MTLINLEYQSYPEHRRCPFLALVDLLSIGYSIHFVDMVEKSNIVVERVVWNHVWAKSEEGFVYWNRCLRKARFCNILAYVRFQAEFLNHYRSQFHWKYLGPCAIQDICLKRILNSKSCGISFAHNLFLSHPIILKFCTEHGSDTAMLCAKFKKMIG